MRTTPGRLRLGPWVSTSPAGISLPKIHKHRNRKTRKILKKFSLVMLRGRFVWFGVCVWLCLLVLRMNQYWGVGARAPRAGRRQQNRRNMTGRTFLRHVCTWTFLFCLWVCAYVGFCFLLWCCAYVDFLIVQFQLYSSIPTQVVIGCLLLWCHLRTSAGQGTAPQRDNRAKARRRPHKGTIGRPHKRG